MGQQRIVVTWEEMEKKSWQRATLERWMFHILTVEAGATLGCVQNPQCTYGAGKLLSVKQSSKKWRQKVPVPVQDTQADGSLQTWRQPNIEFQVSEDSIVKLSQKKT